ncbi:MAG: hypothetical protein RLZZ387_1368 [Chloroflexota bacterium]|jgi:hypothetical protein
MKSYLDFEIAIGALDAGRYALTVRGPGGEASDYLTLPRGEDFAVLLGRLRRLDTDEAALVQIGRELFLAVFAGPTKDVYTRSQGILGPDQGLRLRLTAPPAEAGVHAMPWEFLYDPDQGPLALLDAPVVRYLPQQDRIPSLAAPLPLKVLLSAAQTPPPAEVERELAAVQEALATRPGLVEVTVEPHLTTAKLQRLLREGFHIWHFVGHGASGDAGGTLLFEDVFGEAEPVSALQLNVMLNRSGLRLVVLDACGSGELATDSFRAVAPALIRAQVPAVVAMQFQVPEEATRAFAAEFYRVLAEALPIDACVTEGRRAVMNVTGLRRPDWGIPVIYTRAPDGRLFEPPAPAAPLLPTPPPVQAASSHSIGSGLVALGDLIATADDVREDVIAFRADFLAASEQIALMADYKDIHDQLHSLQFHCYSPIVQEVRRLPDDEGAWENLSNYEITLQGIVDQLERVAGRATLATGETAWVWDLGVARADLGGAIETLDLRQLKKGVRLLNRVLTIQPAQVNARLNAAARSLRLGALAHGLTRVRERLPSLRLDADKVAQFEMGVVALAGLSVRLGALVGEHDSWQAVDLEMRRIEATLDADLSELELSWEDLRDLAAPLYTGIEETWTSALRADAAKLDAALAASDAAKTRHFFRRFRRQAGDRFYRVDIELKKMTDDLRKVGEPLAAVLRLLTS